jgi:membrane associated rhomboid family serine protease
VAETLRCYRHPDRETGVSCSECGRGICPDCMVFAPVGIRCLDHAGQQARPRQARAPVHVPRFLTSLGGAYVTRALVILNVGVFFVNLAQGASLSNNGGSLFIDGALIGRGQLVSGEMIGVAEGEWYRMITAMFLHGSLIHLLLNMVMLYWIGTPMEQAVGHLRFLLIYFVSGICGSAGALLATLDAPNTITVGASGAIFGILGAALVYERQRTFVLGGSALSIIVINLVLGFIVPNISIGGHIGGLIGGAACGLALSRMGRVHAAYGRPGLLGFAGVGVVALAAVVVSYLTVQSY